MSNWIRYTNHAFSFYKQTTPTSEIDPLYWLKSTPLYPKFYWEDREKKECIAAVGSLQDFSEIPYFSPEVLLFCMRPFDEKKKGFPWEGFPLEKKSVLPRFEIHKKEGLCFSVQNAKKQEPSDFPSYSDTPPLDPTSFHAELKASYPNHESWTHLVNKALYAIQHKEFEKVVLARVKEYLLDPFFSFYNYIGFLRKQRQNTFVFLYAPNEEEAFFSFSPERLYQRKNNVLLSEAIAGTDYHRKKNLITNHKEQREFQFVQKNIEEIFTKLCKKRPLCSQPTIFKTQNLRHLYATIQGDLPSSFKEEKLVQTLHPTPATCGYPKEKALPFLLEAEPFTRGLYAAPLGWVRSDSAEFIAGIRSALIRRNHLYLFSGTGLVLGSFPNKEWEELEEKLFFYENSFQ